LQLKVAHEYNGSNVQYTFHVVDEVEEVVSTVVDDLKYLDDNSSNAVEDNDD
jgi:hypothetical protein